MTEENDSVPDLPYISGRKMSICSSCQKKSRPQLKRQNTSTEILQIDTNYQVMMKEVPQTMKIIRDQETDAIVDFVPPAAPTLPIADSRDTHLPQFQTSEIHSWKDFLRGKLDALKSERNVWIDGQDMKQILVHLFGAKVQDFDQLENACDNMNHDPALKFRKVANCRLGLDLYDGTARRLERAPYVLGFNEGFKRHDSGQYR